MALKGEKLSLETKRRMSASKKGKTTWIKGKRHSDQTKNKIREKLLKNNGMKGKLGSLNPFFGKKHDNATRQRMSELKRSLFSKTKHPRLGSKLSKEQIEKLVASRRGVGLSDSHKIKISLAHKGIKHWNWQGGKSSLNHSIRNSFEYKLWRKAVFERDNYTCVWCKKRGGKLNADHIKPFAYFPELRFAIDNGRTLCLQCHRQTDTFGAKAKKSKKLTTLEKL